MYVFCKLFHPPRKHYHYFLYKNFLKKIDMVRKPLPPPLSVSQGKIELEKLAVLKRTELRIADMELAAGSTRISLAFPISLARVYCLQLIYEM